MSVAIYCNRCKKSNELKTEKFYYCINEDISAYDDFSCKNILCNECSEKYQYCKECNESFTISLIEHEEYVEEQYKQYLITNNLKVDDNNYYKYMTDYENRNNNPEDYKD